MAKKIETKKEKLVKSLKSKVESPKETKTIAKKVDIKKPVAKKIVAKKIEKPVAKKAAPIAKKTATKKASIKKDPAEFGILNILAVIAVIAIFAIAGFLINRYNQKAVPAPKAVQAAQSINYDCAEGKTALAILKEKADIKTVDSSFGAYVDSINNTSNNDGSFWIFYVNGNMAEVGPDQYNCKPNDKVEWRYEKIM